MELALDFGGSTLDVGLWEDGKFVELVSAELPSASWVDVESFLENQSWKWEKIGTIFVTGGKSGGFPDQYRGINLVKIGEIQAIGVGGFYLAQDLIGDEERPLVVSMGTGTCMVKVRGKGLCEHIGGTGVGGGTFLGLAKELLGETDVEKLKEMFRLGDRLKVDLSVKDIVGGDIGIVKGEATASNLGRLTRRIDFSKSDLASGMVNLIGQTIGITAVFGAKAYDCNVVVLSGKLTRIEKILEVILQVGEFYGMKMVVPDKAEFVSVVGAMIVGNKLK